MSAKTLIRCLTLAAVSASAVPFAGAAEGGDAIEADIAAGEEKAKVCIACHGERGISLRDNIPHLHGQRQTYLLRQMHTFRDGGDRRDPIMTPMLENMSDQDLVNLAAYFSGFETILASAAPTGPATLSPMPNRRKEAPQPASATAAAVAPAPHAPAAAPAAPATGDAAAGQAKSAACAACHGMDGRGTSPLFPNLLGQKAEYLAHQLRAFRDGIRQDPTMAPMAAALSDQDIADLAVFYAGLK